VDGIVSSDYWVAIRRVTCITCSRHNHW